MKFGLDEIWESERWMKACRQAPKYFGPKIREDVTCFCVVRRVQRV